MPELSSYQEKQSAWKSAIDTLAKLHRVDPLKIGLDDYGSHGDFYPRQIRSLGKVSQAQASVKNEENGDKVGEIPNFDWLIKWYTKNCPKGELTIVHGDYKIDNFVSDSLHPKRLEPEPLRWCQTRRLFEHHQAYHNAYIFILS